MIELTELKEALGKMRVPCPVLDLLVNGQPACNSCCMKCGGWKTVTEPQAAKALTILGTYQVAVQEWVGFLSKSGLVHDWPLHGALVQVARELWPFCTVLIDKTGVVIADISTDTQRSYAPITNNSVTEALLGAILSAVKQEKS